MLQIAETTRGAEAPQEVVACSIFVIGFGLLVFVECPRHEGFLHDPPNREPRANGLLWSLCCSDLAIQPVQASVLRQFFVVLGLVVGQAPNTTPLQKNQLATPHAVLFLLCVSRFVLFLLSCTLLVIVLVPNI
jgi:hypothetical protein